MIIKPKGGTELQLEYLCKYAKKELLDQVQICTSVPEKIPLSKDKVNILWQKNAFNQPNLYPWFKDKTNHYKYDWYVFNSHWNFERFRITFDLPLNRCLVIKNGIDPTIKSKTRFPMKDKPIRIIHHCTPWRGLSVLLGAMQLIKNPKITLDVFSNTELYGKEFHEKNDKEYQPLYEQAKKLDNVNYIGYKSHEYILERMHEYNMFVYPSVWEETSCISLLEAMAAGCYSIVTNFGALYETGAEFAMYVPYDNDYRRLAQKFAQAIEAAAKTLHEPVIHQHLQSQINYTKSYYSWKKQAVSWNRFLEGAINVKQQTNMVRPTIK